MLYSVIIPLHNEKDYIEKMIQSLINQSLQPQEIILIDDNSTDDSGLIIKKIEKQNKIVKAYKVISSDYHFPGSKVVNAFLYGAKKIKAKYDVIVKLDADIILPIKYFETLSLEFNRKSVGIVGGYLYTKLEEGTWVLEHPMDKTHIRGAIKAYSKDCYKKIGGLRTSMGWDTIDEILAKYHGFEIIPIPKLKVLHLRPTAIRYSKIAARLQGEAFYKMRYGFLISLLSALKNLYLKRKIKFFINIIWGLINAYFKKPSFIVSNEEGKFIRKYRMKNIIRKIHQV